MSEVPRRGAIVTGGGGGIGLAIARRLASSGPVGVVDVSEEATQKALRTLRDDGVEASGLVADVGDPVGFASALSALAEVVQPRVLVTAAGYVDYTDPLDLTAEQFQRMLSVHVIGLFVAAKTLHPHLARGDGRIVAIGSLSAQQGSPMHAHYSASKAAIEGLVRSLASAWRKDDIRVNAVLPGTIRTAIFEQVPESVRAGYLAGGVGVGEPEDIAAAVAYLADPESSRYVNGTTIQVDGGSRLAQRPS